jgi:hypothetical protein
LRPEKLASKLQPLSHQPCDPSDEPPRCFSSTDLDFMLHHNYKLSGNYSVL